MKASLVRNVLIGLLVVACSDSLTAPDRGRTTNRPITVNSAIGVDSITGASIETNQDDYMPGEIVHLTLKGWTPGEDVQLHMTESPDTHGPVDTTVTVDGSGEWTGHFYDVQPHDTGSTFTLTATGLQSGGSATLTFTDQIFPEDDDTGSNGSGGTSLDVDVPGNAEAGHLLIAQITVRGFVAGTLVCPEAGWAFIRSDIATGITQHVFWRVATASEPSDYTWTFRTTACGAGGANTNGDALGGMIAYSGVDVTAPIDADNGSTGSGSSTYNAPQVTTTTANTRIVWFMGHTNVSVIGSSTARVYNDEESSGDDRAIAAWDALQAAIGNSVAFSQSEAAAATYIAQTVALRNSLAQKLAIVGGPFTGGLGSCIGPFAVQAQNNAGATANVTAATAINLTTDGSGTFHNANDDDCNGSADATVSIANTENTSEDFYYRASQVGDGSHQLTATHSTAVLASGSVNQTIEMYGTDGGESQTLVVPAPAVSAGDLLVAHIVAVDLGSSEGICAPAGWTSVRRDNETDDENISQQIFYRFAPGAAGVTNYTWNFIDDTDCTGSAVSAGGIGVIRVYSGVDALNPIDAHGADTDSDDNDAEAPSVTTSLGNNNAIVLRFFAADNDINFTTSPAAIYNYPENVADDVDRSVAGHHAVQLTGGTPVGQVVAALSNSEDWVATTVALRMAVASVNTSTSVNGSPNPSAPGQSVTFTATVTASGNPVTTGSVEFRLNSCGGTLFSGPTALNGSGQATGNRSFSLAENNTVVYACYLGSAGFNSSSGSTTQQVNLIATTTNIASSNNPSVTGQSTIFTATITRTVGGALVTTGSVTFETGGTDCDDSSPLSGPHAVNGSGQASTAAQTYQATQSGLVVRACYTEGTTYASSEDAVTQTVNKATTTLSLGSNLPSPYVGDLITFTATIGVQAPGAGSPSGSVNFYLGGACNADGSNTGGTLLATAAISGTTASFQTSALNAGTNTIQACYGGDANFTNASDDHSQLVNKAVTTLALTSSNNPSEFGEGVTFTATVTFDNGSAPLTGLPVNFAIGGTCQANGTISSPTTVLANVALSAGGVATFMTSTLAASATPYDIVACFGGNSNITGDGDQLAQTVNKAVTTTTLVSATEGGAFGNSITLTATVAVTATLGVGTPTGSVEFFFNNACSGTSLGTDPVDGTGIAAITISNATPALLALFTAGTHNLRGCYTNSDGNFVDSDGGDTHTVNAAATTVAASTTTTTPQYSDEITLRAAVTPFSLNGQELTGNVRFYFGTSVVSCPVSDPGTAGAGVIGSDDIVDADNGVSDDAPDYQITSAASSTAYKLTACFYSTNTNFGHDGDDADVTVTTEDATVTPDPNNASSIPMGSAGSFTLTFVVKETNPEPDANAGALAGQLSNVGFGVVLNAVGAGANNETGSCGAGVVTGTGYNQIKTYVCTFNTVAVDAYEVVATVNGNYYDGTGIDALSVYDPNAGFVTGGGKFLFPGTSDKVNFGLVFSNPSKKSIRGNIVVIRHMSNGDICRAKSNALEAPAVVNNAASFIGKGNYSCTRPDGSQYDGGGNLNMSGWVQDNGQGATATGPDTFWFKVTGALNNNLVMPGSAPTGAAPLTGGNIQVPQPGGKP